jgi:hypothetical protein
MKVMTFFVFLFSAFFTLPFSAIAAPMSPEELIQGIQSYRATVRNLDIKYDYYTIQHQPDDNTTSTALGQPAIRKNYVSALLNSDGRFYGSIDMKEVVNGTESLIQTIQCSWNNAEYRSFLFHNRNRQAQTGKTVKGQTSVVSCIRPLFDVMLWQYEYPLEKWGRTALTTTSQSESACNNEILLALQCHKIENGGKLNMVGGPVITEENYKGATVQRVDLVMTQVDKDGKEIPETKKSIWSCKIDPKKSFLPVRIELGHADHLVRATDLELQEISQGIWFPKKMTYAEYAIEETMVPSCTSYFENIQIDLKRQFTDQDFLLEIPAGVKIYETK